jgi:hypothetical protein
MNGAMHPLGKPIGQHVATPVGYLRRHSDPCHLCLDVMRDHGIRLLDERGQRLRRAPPHKVS